MIRFSKLAAPVAALIPLAAAVETGEMQIGDTALPCLSEGEGAPVLFVPGASSDLRACEPSTRDGISPWS